ncbi:MAG: hypothetical protein E6H09_03050 [Bacteroidetes bacterium]|jgi:hypothetical protein|nr:MAG: hypothetical protein E6H09_03050 [Bacteroidota bacterium]
MGEKMDERELKFDTTFKERGGLFDADRTLALSTRKMFDDIKADAGSIIDYLKLTYPNLPYINLDFINSPIINATACRYKGEHYIGINYGCFLLLYDMFSKMFASQQILNDIGNVALETDERKNLSAIIIDGYVAFDLYNTRICNPIDEVRGEFAMAYTAIAVRYLIFHELGHIVRGHTGYLDDTYASAFSEIESPNNEDGKIKYIDRQTMEMDADSFATNHSHLRAIVEINHPEMIPGIFKIINKNIKTFYSHWIFVIYNLLRLFLLTEFNYDKNKLAKHPPQWMRMQLILNNIHAILMINNFDNNDIITSHLRNTIESAESAFCSITFDTKNSELFWLNFLQSEHYGKEIRYNWNNLIPLLKPYALGKLPGLVDTEL